MGDGDGKASVQRESVLEQLKLTPGHAKRNVLKQRAAIIAGEGGIAVPISKEEMQPVSLKSKEIDQKASVTTKSQMLSIQSSSIQKISVEIGELRKEKLGCFKEKLLRAKLDNFEKLQQLGLITKDQMQAEIKTFLESE